MRDLTNNTLEDLAEAWRIAKRDEDQTRKERVEIEEEIVARTGIKEEGSQTHEAGEHKVKVTGKLNRTLDAETWENIKHTIPETMRPVEYKPTLDTKGLRYLENNEPETYAKVAEALTTKPAKPSIEVK